MNRKLIIFGNGLGMALDPNHFSLERALQDIWSEPGFLTQEQKQLIQHCYDHGGPPTAAGPAAGPAATAGRYAKCGWYNHRR